MRSLPALRIAACVALGAGGCASLAPPPAAGPPAGPVAILAERGSAGTRFLGSGACRGCHPGAWARWAATAHASPLAGLPPQSRLDASCLRCHATGYGDRLGYRDPEATPDLAAVGCEACHGAGADHARSRWPALVAPALGGECAPCEANRACRACHTPERSPGFDLARDLARVSCRGPAPPPGP